MAASRPKPRGPIPRAPSLADATPRSAARRGCKAAASAPGGLILAFLLATPTALPGESRSATGFAPEAPRPAVRADVRAGRMAAVPQAAPSDTLPRFGPLDVFELEWASDPRIDPAGERVAYVRNGFDVMKDRTRSELWIVRADGTGHRPLASGGTGVGQPRWSPSGDRIAYVVSGGGGGGEGDGNAGTDDRAEIRVRWMDTGQETTVARPARSPSALAWSPDGARLAYVSFVPGEAERLAEMPPKPEGADWGPPYRVTTALQYRADGRGYLEPGHRHVFVVPAEGGTPRQVTSGPFDHGGPLAWTPDGRALVLSVNRRENPELEPLDSELYRVEVADGRVTALTDRRGPDRHPAVSPDGRRVAYLGFDDRRQGYQVTRLYVAGIDGSDPRAVTGGLDRSVTDPVWAADGSGLYLQYDDEGNTKVAFVALDGTVSELARDVGGLSLGRPYAGGQFSVSPRTGRFAFTFSRPDHPADVALGSRDGSAGRGGGAGAGRGARGGRASEGRADRGPAEPVRLTNLNADLLERRRLARVEEIRYRSSHDGREIQGWIATPPGFDPARAGGYPLLLEIHGGPFANYGDRFAAEIQLYAAAGHVVLYTNPRGSTSYGGTFGNLIHHAYPGHDYEDLMSGVDAVLERGYVDADRLYVTGGSGGGVLTAWIVGKTDRFRAAVVQKPVIDWYSFALTADNYGFYWQYWLPGYPWEHRDHYFERSPISLVGNVSTPTMLIVGERDYRTPASETEQFYGALRLRGVEAAMVRIPDASHGIAARPSNLVGKVQHVLGWLARHGGP